VAVVTFSRQLGSAGTWIARQVAQSLGYRFLDRQLAYAAASRVGAPEMALEQIDELRLLQLAPTANAYAAYMEALRTLVREAAAQGEVVIVGKGGQAILRGLPDVLHILVIAPLDVRIQRVTEEKQVTRAGAERLVDASDRRRASFLRVQHGVDWMDPRLYSLVINTGLITPIAAVHLVLDAVHSLETDISQGRQ